MTTAVLEDLMRAIKARDHQAAAALLSKYPEAAHQKDAEGNSPILIAQYYSAKAIVTSLLECNLDLSIHEAAAIGQTGLVVKQLERSPDLLNSYSHDGYTPLGLAAFFGRDAIAAALLAHGADVHAASRNEMHVTPLHSAAAGRHTAIAKALLLHGADTNARQQSGWTPLHSAVHNGQAELAALLLEHGADRHASNDAGVTPQEMACELGDTPLIELLSP
jgi:ankyrin repeat protein